MTTALKHPSCSQRSCRVFKDGYSPRHIITPISTPHQNGLRRARVAVQSGSFGLETVDWSGLSRMLLPPMLSAAVLRRASDYISKRAAIDEVCRAFQVQDKEELQVSNTL
jgi:hypothetical protein